ncbi:ribonuclease HII [Pseudomarimonas salicorniae]|uniref:Ribonuclease HII n=1 Tax=Pseudomarimonas salicorniae TaxID=2933270 RepID=A0ABT0GDK3_9GAMM|nr:ribonuclease HII [Lysobacter sp. CAU 1642]MCK7592629.1 ribonuclease HII [Lysobacter sp. CAU 1642]
MRYVALTPDSAIAGVDEAGRGPLAGPLVVAAVILDPRRTPAGLDDSKKLTEARREALYQPILDSALAHCIVFIAPEEIDRRNIFQATLHGMRESLRGLAAAPRLALVDGNRIPDDLPCPAEYRIGGDALEPAISAASILAKVSRDRALMALHQQFPQYGFDRHKGYPTPAHLDALRRHGPCAVHRRSFAPVRDALRAPPEQAGLGF